MSSPPGASLSAPVGRLLATTLTVTFLTGCTVGSGPEEPSPDPVAPRSAELDLSNLPVPRTDFCDRLAEDDVAQALDAPVAQTRHYTNGDEVAVGAGGADVVHEYGCVYDSADGATAQAWVFAPQVERARAQDLVRRARRGRDCSFPDALSFGDPTLASLCRRQSSVAGSAGAPVWRARLEGLFGDSWVGCEVSAPRGSVGRAALVRRTGQWCTEVVTAMSVSE